MPVAVLAHLQIVVPVEAFVQGAGAVFVSRVSGSVSNVIGLPLTLLVELARRLEVDLAG